MIQCPECRKMIPDDSAYCDQCGKELKWCPQCKRPKRGTECPLCGSVLVPGRQYLGGGLGGSGGSGASGVSGVSGGSGLSGVSGASGVSGGGAGGFGGSGGALRGGAPFGGASGTSGGASGGGAAFGGASGVSGGGVPFGGASGGGSGISGGVSDGGIVPTALVGNGWRLILQEGPFGRTGGIWPELASCRYVSGNHGRISKTAAGWQVEDCGSTNGTFVNGARIQKQILKRGDILRIATLDFTLE